MGFYNSLHALEDAIANESVKVERDENGTYVISGNTYPHKDFIKRELGFAWDREGRVWTNRAPRETIKGELNEWAGIKDQQPEPEAQFEISDAIDSQAARDLGTVTIDREIARIEAMGCPESRRDLRDATLRALKDARAALVAWQAEINAKLEG